MPRDAYYLPADPLNNAMDDGVGVDLDGGIFIRRKNLIVDQFFSYLRADGMPTGIDAREGASDGGYHLYVGEDRPGDMMRQTFEPWEPDRDRWSGEQALVDGPSVPRKDSDTFPLDTTLDPLEVRFRPNTEAGFPAADYWYCVAAVTPGGAYTETTELVQFTHTTDGAPIDCPLPADMPDGGQKWAIFLSEEDGDRNTVREQRVVPGWMDTFTLHGPYRRGRERPQTNETFIGRPPQPQNGHKRDFHLRHAAKDMQEMWLSLSIVATTPRGTSLPSIHSERKHYSAHKNHGVALHPDKLHPDANGVMFFCQIDDPTVVTNPPWYQLIGTHRTNKAKAFHWPRDPEKEPIILYGLRESEVAVAEGTNKKDDKVETTRFLLVPADPPTEDTSGVESPVGETELPTTGAGGSLPTGKRLYATYTRVFNGRQTQAAPTIRFTIPANKIADLILPPRVNLIPNSLSLDILKSGRPVGWVFDTTSGDILVEPGKTWARTLAAISNTSSYPNARMPLSPVRRGDDQITTIRGILEVRDYGGIGASATAGSAGVGVAQIWQYQASLDGSGNPILDADGNPTYTEISSSRISVTTLNQKGYKEFKVSIAGADVVGTDLAWHDDAEKFRLVATAEGNPRNLSVTIHGGAAHPFPGAPPRFIKPTPGDPSPAAATLDPTVPYENGSFVVVGAPAAPPGAGSGDALLPLKRSKWNTVGAFDGWTQDKSTGSGFVSSISAAGAIEGAAGLYSEKNTTASKGFAGAYYSFLASIDGTSLAARFLFRADQLPSYSGSWARIGRIENQSGSTIGYIELKQNGTMRFASNDFPGGAGSPKGNSPITIFTGYSANQILDIEIQVVKAESSGGEFIVTIGYQGGARTTYRQACDLDPSSADRIWLGGHAPTDARVKWKFRYDDAIVTPFGWPGDTTTGTPTQAIALPDRPYREATAILSPSSDGTQAITPSTRQNGSAQVRINKTANPAATRTPLQIRNASAPATLAEFRLLTGNTYDFRATDSANVTTTIASGSIGATDDFYVEIEVDGADTSLATIHAYLYRPTEERERIASFALDLTGRPFTQAIFTGAAEYSNSERQIYNDARREYQSKAPDGSVVRQITVSSVPDDSAGNDVGWEIEETFVKPGQVYTFAVEEAHEFAPIGVEPCVLIGWDASANPYELGEIFPGGVSTRDKVWSDVAVLVTPPSGYWRFTTAFRNNTGGTFKFQRPLLAPGNLTASGFGGDATAAQAARDALRTDQLVDTAQVRGTFRAKIPNKGIQDDFEETLTRVAIKNPDVPPLTTLTAGYRHSPLDPPSFSGSYGSAASIPAQTAYVDVLVDMATDPTKLLTPYLPSGALGVTYSTHRSLLCREDRSPIPGGCLVTGLIRPTPLPEYRTDVRPGGHSLPVPTTDPIMRADGLLLDFFTGEGLEEFLRDQINALWLIEHVATGRSYLVQLDAPVSIEDPYEDIHEELRGFQYITCTAESFEVIEAGTLE